MNRALAALHRAINRRTNTPAPAPVNLTPTPAPLPVVQLRTILVDPADTLTYTIGPYAADPRIVDISSHQIGLTDGSTIRAIAEPYHPCTPDAYARFGLPRICPRVWRLYRPDASTSIFWWPDLVDALADVLGPAQFPIFAADVALAALTPDSDLLPQEH